MANTETLLTLFPCRKTKVLYTLKKSSPLKASCITQLGVTYSLSGARRANLAALISGVRSVSDNTVRYSYDIKNLYKTLVYLKQNSHQNCSFLGKN